MIGWILLAVICLFLAIVTGRALAFTPRPEEPVTSEPLSLNRDKIVADMVSMVRCRTVSNRDESKVDRTQFAGFESLLEERFPLVHQNCVKENIGKTGLLFFLKGASHARPSVCMAHYDVVPADEDGWTKPPFDGLIEDGCIWGRGTLDTKGTLCAILEATEYLLAQGYQPQNDLYFSFSGEEEIDGDTCRDIVHHLRDKGVTPAIVLDEGGAVVKDIFPGIPGQYALVGIGEKGSVNMDFSMDSPGGHASTPPVHTVLGQLSDAVRRIERHPFRRQLTKPVKETFDVLGRHAVFPLRIVFANLWCFLPLLDVICKKSGGALNAMMRTTVAVTRMEGSKAYNVLPPKASFGINMRLLGDDTIASATAYLQKIIKNENIRPRLVDGMNPSIYSDTACDEWLLLKDVIRATWPDAVVSPYLMVACSDSRHYCEITDRVYRFSPMCMSDEEQKMIHGNNERIPIATLMTTVEFYVRLLKKL